MTTPPSQSTTTPPTTTAPPTGASTAVAEKLRRTVRGRMLTAGDPDWDAVRVSAGSIRSRPSSSARRTSRTSPLRSPPPRNAG